MDPSSEDHRRSLSNIFWRRSEVSNDHHFAVVASSCFGENRPPYLVFVGRGAKLGDVGLTVRVSVRVAVSKVNFIMVMFELELEGESVVVGRNPSDGSTVEGISKFSLGVRVLIVRDVITHTSPASIARLSILHRVNQWLHPVIEGRVRLHKVNEVEGVLTKAAGVLDFEEEPLGEIVGRVVGLQGQLVLILVQLDGFLQVPTLKSAFKYQSVILRRGELVERI